MCSAEHVQSAQAGRLRQESPMIDDDQKPRRQSDKHRTWRVVNTSILLFAFFSPWLSSCSGRNPYSGLDVTLSRASLNGAGAVFGTIGGICVLLYALTNLIRAASGNRPHSNRWLRISLAGSIIGLLGMRIGPSVSSIDSGYCLTGVGILSSLILEARDLIQSRSARGIEDIRTTK
jgi:hypothetical protein